DGSFGPLKNLDGTGLHWMSGNWKKREKIPFVSQTDRGPTADEKNAAWAVEKLKDFAARPDGKPFFMGVGFIRPHTPLIVPQKYFDRFPLESSQLPDILANDAEDTFKHTVTSPEDDRSGDRGSKMYKSLVASYDGNRDHALKLFIQAYLASVVSVDDLVGDILTVIDETALKDNTIIVFTSDHGWGMGEKDYLYKNSLWQESTRVPLAIRAPGVSSGHSDHPVSLIDLYPTLLELCDLPRDTLISEKGHPLEGHSLKPLLEDPVNGDWEGPDAALTALYKWARYYDPAAQNYSLRSKDWRYVRYENGKEELYHCANDPHEWTNLALNPEYSGRLQSFRKQLSARIPPSKPKPDVTAEDWKARYFKKHPEADTNRDGQLSWPELKAHKA
ncbi:MAG: sulfatase-like hydrolase/transferase, partial [Verrucomicrobiota bacterium]